MKFEKIKRLCAATKTVDIAHHEASGDTWLGNGHALYRVDDGIEVNERNVAALLDLDEKQLQGMRIMERTVEDPRYDSTAAETEDFEALYPGPVYDCAGVGVMLLRRGIEAAGIDRALLAPVYDKYYMEYRVRRGADGGALIAVHNNMMCCALILPVAEGSVDAILRDMADWATDSPMRVTSDPPEATVEPGEQLGMEDVEP